MIDVLLALVALAAVALSIMTALRPAPRVAAAYAALLTLAGAVALALVVFRAIDEPGLPGDVATVPAGARLETSIEGGLWLALAALVAIVAFGALALGRERLAPGRREAAGSPVATSA